MDRLPYQRYLLHELTADIGSGHNVRSNGLHRGPLDVPHGGAGGAAPRWVRWSLCRGLPPPAPAGFTARAGPQPPLWGTANLNLGDRVEPVLEALRGGQPQPLPRHPPQRDLGRAPPRWRTPAAHKFPGQLSSAEFRAGARVLAGMGLTLEGWLFFHQLPELADFARAVPELTIIVNHIGGLLGTGPYANRDDEVLPIWRSGVAAVATCPNVYIKLGGIGMPRTGFDWHTRAPAGRLRGAGVADGAAAHLLHRSVRAATGAVREQLPSGTRSRIPTTCSTTRSSDYRRATPLRSALRCSTTLRRRYTGLQVRGSRGRAPSP